MPDKTLGAYTRHESPDYCDGGVTAAQVEKEADGHGTAFWMSRWKEAAEERVEARRQRNEAHLSRDYWLVEHSKAEERAGELSHDLEAAQASRDSWKAKADQYLEARDRAVDALVKAKRTIENLRAEMAACDVHDGVMEVTGDMRAAARAAFTEHTGIPTLSGEGGSSADFIGEGVHLALTAALTPPPARHPEAERIEAVLDDIYTAADVTHRGDLADHLASRGVRVEVSER